MATATTASPSPFPPFHQQEEQKTTLAEIDQEFQKIGCLGHGGFGSVFLAKKKSGRKVALKFTRFRLDCVLEDEMESFHRELDAVLQLECTTSNEGHNRDLSVVHFEDWFIGTDFAAIVMQYCDGKTLSDEILSKSDPDSEPYTERRIAWYALQLSEALAYAHQRGVYHTDVKSANVLIDRTGGGKLLLADFGSSIGAGEEAIRFTEIYASPEFQDAVARDDFSGLEADKIDSFGLGCIIFEMLCCKKLVDLTQDETLAEFIKKNQVDAALNLPCFRLPWATESASDPDVAYSSHLKGLVKTLLEALPSNRWSPTELQKPIRQDPLSPLLVDFVTAAQTPRPGAPVTIDNVQLGMFVQRGIHWADGDQDGGPGSVGVVVKLDADGGYTEVAFPTRAPEEEAKSLCCRIGAGNKYELQVGPTPLGDFYAGSNNPKGGGLIYGTDVSNCKAGQLINNNCMVVGVDYEQNRFMVAPMERITVPALQVSLPIEPAPVGPANPRKPMSPPESWTNADGAQVEVVDDDEKGLVIEPFYAIHGGLDLQRYEIVSVKRIQQESMWTSYALACEQVASESWGIVNERRLFHGSGRNLPEHLLGTPDSFYQLCSASSSGGSGELIFSAQSKFGDKHSYRTPSDSTLRTMIMSRVALGRVDERTNNDGRPARPSQFAPLDFHSVHHRNHSDGEVYTINNPFQCYPEYIITYRVQPQAGRRMVRARRPGNRNRPDRGTNRRPIPRRPRQQVSPTTANTSTPFSAFTMRPVDFIPSPVPATPPPVTNGADTPATPGLTTAKMCVVCLDKPVNHMLIPCGHPCLCAICATQQGLTALNHKCPECRQRIREAVRFYGTVVEE